MRPNAGVAVAASTVVGSSVGDAVGTNVGVATEVEFGCMVAVGRTGAVAAACVGVGEGARDCVAGVAALREGDSNTDDIGGRDCGAGEAWAAAITLGVAPSMKSINVLSEYEDGLGVDVLYGNRDSTVSKSSGRAGAHAIPNAIITAGSKISRGLTD